MILVLYSVLITSSICMLLTSNPVSSVLFLMISFICVSFIFISIGVDFVGFLILIVYAGAIAILFLFIVMLISVKRVTRDTLTYFIIGGVFLFTFSIQLFFVLFSSSLVYVPSFLNLNSNS